MIESLLVAVAMTCVSYVAFSMLEERLGVKKRIAVIASGRLNIAPSSLDKDRIIAKVQKEQKELSGKRQKKNKFDNLLSKSGLAYSKGQVFLMCLGFGALCGLIVLIIIGHILIAIFAGAVSGILVPRIVLGILVARREIAFIDELPNALDLLSRGLRAGMPLGTCLRQVADSTADPLKTEFAHVLDLHKLGLPLAEAIKRMPERIDLMDLRFFTIVIEIQQRSGGNLAEILENISGVIRGRKEMKAKIKALISEAKTSSYIIGAVPVFFSILSYWSDPNAFSRFWTEPIGQVLSLVAVGFYVGGILLFSKIARVRV